MALIVQDDLLKAAGTTPEEARRLLAVAVYVQGQASFGAAARLANMDRQEFQKLLGRHRVPMGPSADDLDKEALTLRRLKLL